MKRLIPVALAILLILIFISASGCVSEEKTDRLTVAVSVIPEETFVKAVAGDLVDTVVMIPPGSNPENYEPTPQQKQKLEKAGVYFAIGVPAETGILKSIPLTDQNRKLVFLNQAAAEKYPQLFIGNEPDPHIWLSPKRAAVMVEKIAQVLSDADPKNAATYTKNAAEYTSRLKNLETEIAEILQNSTSKTFIVYHPAFGYFADDFGLKQIALEDEGKEATIQHLMNTVDFAKANSIKIIFYQDEIDASQAKSFAEEIDGHAVALSPLSGNYIENLRTMAQEIANA